jgi:hypothetical protein
VFLTETRVVADDTPGSHIQDSLKMCTGRPLWCKHGGSNPPSLEMHYEAIIKCISKYALGGIESAKMVAVI